MRFLADMGISRHVVEWLKNADHNAIHLREQGLQTLRDPFVLKKARDEDRILLTMDLDFGYLLAQSGWQAPSTIIFRLDDETAESVIPRLEEAMNTCGEALQAGAILAIRQDSIRVRRLPIVDKTAE